MKEAFDPWTQVQTRHGLAADEVISEALEKAGCRFEELEFVVSTGYARHSVSFSSKAISEIICHALPGRAPMDAGTP